eukprot:1026635-Amphidinium_carterae.3
MGKAMTRCIQSPSEAKTQYMEWALGSQTCVIASTLGTCVLKEQLEKAYFTMVQEDDDYGEEELQHEDDLAQRHVSLAAEVAGHIARTMMEFTSTLPYMFLPLLSDEYREQQVALEKLRDLWESVQHLEQREESVATNWVAALLWPACPSIRQLLIYLEAIKTCMNS